MASAADVVVIGAGHNGLTAACYLARAGLSVEVVESDDVIGGAVSTIERFPGYRVDRGSSLHVMIRWTGIAEELELDRFGLRYLDCDPWGFFPIAGAPGGGITFRVDLDRTCDSIEAVCGAREAEAYRRFVTDWSKRTKPMLDAFNHPATPGRLGKAMWQAGRHVPANGLEISRQMLSAGDAVLDESFRDERLRTALAWMGAQSGPPMSEPGTAGHLGWSAMMHVRPPGRPVGGSGALSEALAKRLESDGGRVRLGAAARSVTVRGGRVTGVVTAGGRPHPGEERGRRLPRAHDARAGSRRSRRGPAGSRRARRAGRQRDRGGTAPRGTRAAEVPGRATRHPLRARTGRC